MEQAAADWRYDQVHKERKFHDGTFPTDLREWATERSLAKPYHYRDGVTLWIADVDLAPHDHFLGDGKACPECNPEGEEVTSGGTP